MSVPKGTGSVTPSSNNGHGGMNQNQPYGGQRRFPATKPQPKPQTKNEKQDKK
jgi:hypothetical protein